MISKYKNRAIIGVSAGLGVGAIGITLATLEMIPASATLILYAIGLGLYIWGCLALARAKGYSSAIVLTVILGVLFPAVVLLALPDKNKYYRR